MITTSDSPKSYAVGTGLPGNPAILGYADAEIRTAYHQAKKKERKSPKVKGSSIKGRVKRKNTSP
jgi:hypothetical protein